jgi:hypothetical protein
MFQRFWRRVGDEVDGSSEAALERLVAWKTTTCGTWSAVSQPARRTTRS